MYARARFDNLFPLLFTALLPRRTSGTTFAHEVWDSQSLEYGKDAFLHCDMAIVTTSGYMFAHTQRQYTVCTQEYTFGRLLLCILSTDNASVRTCPLFG